MPNFGEDPGLGVENATVGVGMVMVPRPAHHNHTRPSPKLFTSACTMSQLVMFITLARCINDAVARFYHAKRKVHLSSLVALVYRDFRSGKFKKGRAYVIRMPGAGAPLLQKLLLFHPHLRQGLLLFRVAAHGWPKMRGGRPACLCA